MNGRIALGVVSLGLCLGACLERELKPLTPCLVSGVSRTVNINNIDKIDLLFMVDNSNSMREEQAALREQFPKLVRVLTTGLREPGDPDPFPPVKDLHVGVVSSDMGTPGNTGWGGCDPNGGDDGRLQHEPRLAGCQASYPNFLSFRAGDNPDAFSNDFGCIATLGTEGCGFEQQLEAPLKALWPSVYTDPKGDVRENPIRFLSTDPMWMGGRGDIPPSAGGNAGFLRNDPRTGLSLIAIVVVTDEEDCSAKDPRVFTHPSLLSPTDPLYSQDPNLRCYHNPQSLYDVRNRYLKGFQLLREGQEDLVLFAAIVGVPLDLVNEDARKNINFKETAQRDAYYDRILGDSRMAEMIDPATPIGMKNLIPSCFRPSLEPGGKPQTAFPPRRIVELAKAFGQNGVVQSICQDDFGPAMDVVIETIIGHLTPVCLPRPLVRKADGLVDCQVVWELPKLGMAPDSTPTSCDQAPSYLAPVSGTRAATNTRGGQNCEVAQLPLLNGALPAGMDGWYYDNFSAELAEACRNQPHRVAFTNPAKPPTGVIVKLECLNEVQKIPTMREDLGPGPQPEIGSECGNGVAAGGGSATPATCTLTLRDGQPDNSLFCHAERNVCVQHCTSDTECPPAWVCDTRSDSVGKSGGGAFCVNPTCGSE